MATIHSDLQEAQKALEDIVRILDAIKGGTPILDLHYEIGRALGRARSGLIFSGAGRRWADIRDIPRCASER